MDPWPPAGTDPPPRFAHTSVFGPEMRTRRLSAPALIGLAAAVSAVLAIVVGGWLYARADHGSAVQVQATAIGQVDLRQTDNGTNSICHATMRVIRPRRTTRHIEVPCGVATGRPTTGYLYADGTLSMLDPVPPWQLVTTAIVVGLIAGFACLVALTLAILVWLRVTRWLEDR